MSDRFDESRGGATLSNWHRDIVTAIRFLTRIPIGRESELRTELAAAAWAFPFVGALLGVIGGAAFAAAIAIGLPTFLAALIALAAVVLATGALHEDGLADTADGLGGGSTPDARLKIMRDSRIGAFGTLALIFSILVKAGALAALADWLSVALAFVAAASLSRGVLPWLMMQLPLASETGLAASVGYTVTKIRCRRGDCRQCFSDRLSRANDGTSGISVGGTRSLGRRSSSAAVPRWL